MALTWNEMDKVNLTWSELEQIGLTWSELDNFTYQDLLNLTKEKIQRLKELPDDTPISENFNNQINKIYEVASEGIPSLKIEREPRWSKKPTEILFTAICTAICTETVKLALNEIASLLSLIISAIMQARN